VTEKDGHNEFIVHVVDAYRRRILKALAFEHRVRCDVGRSGITVVGSRQVAA
jgi:hypothetical protein